jgi:hypothetical protein
MPASAVDHDLVAPLGHAAADLLDAGLEPAAGGGDASSSDEGHTHSERLI